MLILIVDKVETRCELLTSAIGALTMDASFCYFGSTSWSPSGKSEEVAELCLYHWGDKDVREEETVKSLVDTAKIKIAYRSEGIGLSTILESGWQRIFGRVGMSGFPSPQEWEELLRWINSGSNTDNMPTMLRPEFRPLSVALLTLCRGFLGASQGLVGEGTLQAQSDVFSPRWWKLPFHRAGVNLHEVGADELPLKNDDVKALVEWFSGFTQTQYDMLGLTELVKRVEMHLSEKLGANSVAGR